MYSQSPHFKKKEVSGSGSPDYRSGAPLGAVNLRASASGSSLTSPSKNRRIRTSPRNKNDHHYSVENMEAGSAYNTDHGLSALEALASPKMVQTSQQKFFSTNNLQGRSSSMTNVGLTGQDYSSDQRELDSISFGREGSLDRRGYRHYRHNSLNRDGSDGFSTFSGRDRSQDREYPVMGARSLERDHSNLHRSRSIDQEYILNQATYFPTQPEYIHTRETLIIDLQSQLAELNKECAILQQSVDTTKEKLNSSMNSIKTFWSPELKKERQLRKEESNKLNSVTEQYRMGIEENKRVSTKIRELENEIKHLQSSRATPPPASPCLASTTGGGGGVVGGTSPTPPQPSPRRGDKHAKENKLLRKTIEEMELRIETQKQTLGARDASIKKLLEMLQGRGLASDQYEEDRAEIDRWREKAVVEERRAEKLENLLDQKEKELDYLNQVVLDHDKIQASESPDVNRRHSADLLTLEAMVETKDVKISSLQFQLTSLKAEVEKLREGGAATSTPGTPTRSNPPGGGVGGQAEGEVWRTQEKVLRAKLESLKSELSRKDAEVGALHSKATSAEQLAADKEHLVHVLKEQVVAKEAQISLLQADMSSLRSRVQDKETQIGNKGRVLVSAQQEVKQCQGQILELRDQIEIRQRRIVGLEKKVESLEDCVRDKETTLLSTQARLSTLQADRSSSNTAVESLQETITEQEGQIAKLKSQRDQTEREHQREAEQQQRHLNELKNKLNSTEAQVIGKQEEISVLKEEMATIKHDSLQRDLKVNQEREENQRNVETVRSLQREVEQLQENNSSASQVMQTSLEQQIASLKEEVNRKEGEVTRTQNELDRLLDILKTTENEKNRKDEQIKELQEHIKGQKSKIGNLKKSQQDDKAKSAQILEDAQKRETNISDDTSALRGIIAQKEDRVEELEEALRESVRITAQREMVVHELEVKVRQADIKVKTMAEELEHMREHCKECAEEVTQLRDRLQEKGELLGELSSERNSHMLEVYDMKQEAILAAITEKDAHIALIEMSPISGTGHTIQEVEGLTQEKQHLQRKLKDLTEQRMKILAEEKAKSSPKKTVVSNGNSTQAVIDDNKKSSIWT